MPIELSQEARDFGFTDEHVKQMANFLRRIAERPGEMQHLHMEGGSDLPEPVTQEDDGEPD